jgi:1-acyl-sn-glycerol-3-phosphate acyltransferase
LKQLRFIILLLFVWPVTAVYAILLLLVWPISDRWSYLVARQWCAVVLWLAKAICGLSYRINGIEKFPADSCIFFIKHASTYETFAQLVFLPRACWVLKRELLWIPFFGWCLKPLKAIAIDRSSGRVAVGQVIEKGTRRLNEGISVSIFPEGTRMPIGTTRRYGKSGTLLAQESGHLIVPIAHNAGYFWPKGRWAIEPGEVRFTVGDPVDPTGRDAEEVNREIQAWVEAEVERLADAR